MVKGDAETGRMELDGGRGGDVEGQRPQGSFIWYPKTPLQKGQHAEKAEQLATCLRAQESCPTSENLCQVPSQARELAAPLNQICAGFSLNLKESHI